MVAKATREIGYVPEEFVQPDSYVLRERKAAGLSVFIAAYVNKTTAYGSRLCR